MAEEVKTENASEKLEGQARTKESSPKIHMYKGHEVEVVGQALPEHPDYNPQGDPTLQALVKGARGRHQTVSVLELEPPVEPFPAPSPAPPTPQATDLGDYPPPLKPGAPMSGSSNNSKKSVESTLNSTE